MRFLRQNTATRVTVGPFLDVTDAKTPEVALTATNEHLTLVVDTGGVPTLVIDANLTASGGDNDFVHITNDDAGFYDLELTAAQTNYVGRAIMSINYVTDHLPVFHEFFILPANVYDALLGTDALQVHTNEITNGLIAAATFASGALDAAALATDAVNEIADGILTRQMTESYNTDGVAPTLAQAMFVVMQRVLDFVISGTTISVKKIDGSTEAFQITLNSGTNPTSSSRTT